MKIRSLAGATFVALLFFAPMAMAQVSATANGGAGGAGGSAAGGTATGGTATSGTATGNTSSNTNNSAGGASTATGGTNAATGNTSSIGSATSNYQGADVSVNYTTPAGAAGLHGLAAGVDPVTGHVVSDNNVNYSGTTRIKNTPDVNIGGPASGICNGLSGGVGVGIPGLAVTGNISTVDKGCEARETARIAAMLGRMDVANAILENMEVVMSALKARNDREAQAAAALAAQNLASNAKRAAAQVELQAAATARQQEAEAMRAQQQAGVDALARQATMQKVNDTLTFTGKLTHGEEKTPQQVMAEQLAAKQAEPSAVAAPAPAPSAPQATTPAAPAPAQAAEATQPLRVAAPAPTPSPADTARSDAAPSTAPTTPIPDKRSGARAQAAPLQAPTTVARQQAADTDKRVERRPKTADQVDAVRFALNLNDDSPPVAAR